METATAHDALTELTAIFTNAEIARVLDVVPETVSRLKNEDREPRAELADRLDAFHYVVHRALSRMAGNRSAVRWAILRRQESLDGGTIADLLRQRLLDRALQVLETQPVVEMETAEDLTVSAELDAALLAAEKAALSSPAKQAASQVPEEERFLAENPDLRSFLPSLVEEVSSYLGSSEVSLFLSTEETGEEELVVAFTAALGFEEAGERMRRFYSERWDELMAPYADRLSLAVE
ncbi:MAG: hypothetical protein H0X39_05510 [Actinobacteria bacterium]|nr:hypothetical protein [Actinomycetota bacterium]